MSTKQQVIDFAKVFSIIESATDIPMIPSNYNVEEYLKLYNDNTSTEALRGYCVWHVKTNVNRKQVVSVNKYHTPGLVTVKINTPSNEGPGRFAEICDILINYLECKSISSTTFTKESKSEPDGFNQNNNSLTSGSFLIPYYTLGEK